MWTAEIIQKQILKGGLVISVKYSDGANDFVEAFETKSGQGANWINKIIWARINDLNDITSLGETIPLGTYTPTPPAVDPGDPARVEYASKLAKFYRFENMIHVGVINDTNANYIELKQWLKDNYIASYNTIF